MNNFFNKILGIYSKNIKKNHLFENDLKNIEINKIFGSINKFSAKSEIRFVGGCIRKILNKEQVDDIDLATNLNPEKLSECLKKNKINFYDTGIKHGTLTATINKKNFEITSLRKDISTDGRHALVKFSEDWYEDAKRRDFTINSIYADYDGNLFDPFDGKKDLENGKINFIGDADRRIKEDYLRILRYVRFFLNYSKFDHDPNIKKIIKQNINGVINLSKERLIDELKKIVKSEGFLKINKDDFCFEIVLLIFPQLKHINIFNKLNDYSINNIKFKDFDFLLSLMIIDDSDNTDYFLYKYNLSNNSKKRIKFLQNIFSKNLDNEFFSEKNLWKIYYLNGKEYLIDMINFKIFRSKKVDNKLINMIKFFKEKKQPIFPIKATDLMEKYNLKESKMLGQKLKEIENIWVNNSFKISDSEIEKIVNN